MSAVLLLKNLDWLGVRKEQQLLYGNCTGPTPAQKTFALKGVKTMRGRTDSANAPHFAVWDLPVGRILVRSGSGGAALAPR